MTIEALEEIYKKIVEAKKAIEAEILEAEILEGASEALDEASKIVKRAICEIIDRRNI